jgi:hypothetical protein
LKLLFSFKSPKREIFWATSFLQSLTIGLFSISPFAYSVAAKTNENPHVCEICKANCSEEIKFSNWEISIKNSARKVTFKRKVNATMNSNGDQARVQLNFKEGSLSFKDRYGCVEEPRWTWTQTPKKNPLAPPARIVCSKNPSGASCAPAPVPEK